jgi:hypothetical protein
MLSPRNKGAGKRFREPFGKAGLTVAILALVFAMVGGAYAAGKLTSKQKKEVEKIAKKFQGTGPAGAAGPAGAKGDNGSNGSNGDTGPQGKEGPQGKQGIQGKEGSPWTASGTLPPGETETGYWDMTEMSDGGGAATAISFPIPLAEGGEEGSGFGFKLEETENEEFGTSGCSGSASEPTAPPGVLCVYTAVETVEGIQTLEPRSFQEGLLFFGSYGKTGAYLVGPQPTPGTYLDVWGTWAVTAP